MDSCGCADPFEIFDQKTADEDLARYRQDGPDRTTRMLLDMIRSVGLRGATILDVGAGIGVIDHELLDDVAEHAILVDASAPAIDAARAEARRRGHLDRMEFVEGDFVAQASDIDRAQIVTLDRVVCCYADVGSLVRMSASRARALYGLVLPRDRTIVRLGLRLLNVWFRIRGIGYRSYAHPNRVVDALVADAGLRPRIEDRTFAWRVVLYDRPGMPA
jgi:magnesium-protoporphyrin O-methyltransferase